MNAKKIMGAVLVALLAAALFVGAGAAALANGDVVFVNQKVEGLSGTWTSGTNSITALQTADGEGYFTGEIVEGAYTNGTGSSAWTITVKYPAISAVGLANFGDLNGEYKFINGVLYAGTDSVNLTIEPLADVTVEAYYITIPETGEVKKSVSDMETLLEGNDVALGEYSIRVLFAADSFVNGTLYTDRISKPVTFTVVEAESSTIAASVDQALPSDAIKVTITGQPGKSYKVEYKEDVFTIEGDQLGLPGVGDGDISTTGFTFNMPNSGKVEFTVKLGEKADKTAKMTVKNNFGTKANAQSVTITVLKGTLSAKAEAASYFVGDIIKITGTSTAGKLNASLFELTGTNFEQTNLSAALEEDIKYSGTEWSFKLNTSALVNEKPTSVGKMIDVGTYTLTIVTENKVKATLLISLKQPFLSIAEAPEVIAQDSEAEFIINAEATTEIAYYVFGTNFFKYGIQNETVEDTENQFSIEFNKTETLAMDAGQYFMVIQHPMYDKEFQIMAEGNAVWLIEGGLIATATSVDAAGQATILFNVDKRQTANAAQALCDALDTQNIDDMYIKYSFFVVGKDASFTISDIPATIAQGETLTISGVSTANAGNYVTVEMISTAFAAVPKETVGSAAFIGVTTQVADDGTWEVTLDTSDLNVDEYSLKVACEGQDWKNVNINVVEAGDEPVNPEQPEEPEQPEQPEEPVAPATPGFGALAALAGLGAVAVLLLRRE